MQIGVIRFPGTNNEHETARAISSFGVNVDIIDHFESERIQNYDGYWFAGGFSFSDTLRAGAIASMTEITQEIIESNKPVLGVCNGFQILVESNALPGALIANLSTRFICKWINLRIPNNSSYLSDLQGEILKLPIAHFEGNYWQNTEPNVIGYYASPNGNINSEHNPNGSMNNIAGVASSNGKMVGLMPHPERASFKHQGSVDGRKIIELFLQEVKK